MTLPLRHHVGRVSTIGGAALAVLAVLAAAGCDNIGADRSIGVQATGIVRGFVYFDANGSRSFDAADVPFLGARIRILSPVSRDTIYRATTLPNGTFRLTGVPVGTYAVVLDSASAGDTARVVSVDFTTFAVVPGDSVVVTGAISYPEYFARDVRTLPLGTRVFVSGVALHARGTFSDTILHVADSTGAIRAGRLRATDAAAGDSIRLRGTVATRLGQRSVEDAAVFIVGSAFIPTARTITTASAATAAAGTLDAALVRVANATVSDTSTVAGNLTMTVSDGSGALTVVLDRASDASFRSPFPPGLYVAPNRFDIVGVLVPTGTGGWRLRPRSFLDLTRR
ncbi:MAG: hypothetical protein KJZ74_04700 [Gemmatimonadales bacterium]|nr:hypothetical protein [Gemmatimonadota bacterium]MCL4213192.1 hypothetical protein [Gemmatimonadales bacterium]